MSELQVARPRQMQPATSGQTVQPALQPNAGQNHDFPMTGSELRAQLRMQQACNCVATLQALPMAGVASLSSEPGDNAPRYRWLILEPDGRRREVCCLPERSRDELSVCYPSARLIPLSDSAADSGELARHVK